MSLQLSGTPCPVPRGSDAFLASQGNDSTLNFTSAFRPSLHNAKPRRPRGSVAFAIHDDSFEKDACPKSESKTASHSARCGGPVRQQTLQQQSIFPPTSQDHMISVIHPLRTSRLAQAPKRPAARLSTLPENSAVKEEAIKNGRVSPKAIRQARRGTLYIPSEDTTMPSMYMGIFSPIKNCNGIVEETDGNQSLIEMTGIAAQMAAKKESRKSIMGAAPRRAPLQTSARTLQETAKTVDRYGQGGGKENVPPGLDESSKLRLELKLGGLEKINVDKEASVQQPVIMKSLQSTCSSVYAPTASSSNRINARPVTRASPVQQLSTSNCSKPTWNGGSRQKLSQPIPTTLKRMEKPVLLSFPEPVSKPRVPSRFVIPTVKPEPLLKHHALLSENIVNPQMYEDNWLSHQEIAITQLVNNLFKSSQLTCNPMDTTISLRQQLLSVYVSDSMSLLHKRLHAALLYGVLGIPQEVLDQGDSLSKDLGRKQRFLDLWLQTYNHNALEAGLEVVIGRQCRTENARKSNDSGLPNQVSKKCLQNYIEAFLLRNEDGTPDDGTRNRAAWSYHRTMHRSLMLMKVLDLIKTDPAINMPIRLFQSSSNLKSSTTVVQSLFQMLNTAAGHPIRALGHMNYYVSHIQLPLEEFNYNIENIAVNMRDGTRLTRLVELLLYPSASRNVDHVYDADATTTIIMPEGENVDFHNGCDWPLSQHLKFPCQARVPMLWNVQIALSAIHNVKGMKSLIDGISAEDIVDGYREKTVRLLWALVGKWGLVGLLDWKDVVWETRRLHLQTAQSFDNYDDDIFDTDPTATSFESCKSRLKEWARAVAASNHVPIRNFTTSFADGKVFEAIINEYEPFLNSRPSSRKPSLQERLTDLGCSSEFAQLFSAGVTHVFDRDFVLAALAFLCSRLLAPSKQARAAVVIQRSWRRHWNKTELRRKEQKKQVAVACAKLVIERYEDRTIVAETAKSDVRRENVGIDVASPESVSGTDIWLSL